MATSSSRENFDLKIRYHARAFKFFRHVVLGEEVVHGKPSPDIYTECGRRFDHDHPPSPETCLAFEDAPKGVTAAKAAGMSCVMIPDARLIGNKEATGEADLVLEDAHEFKPEAWGLPPFGYSDVTHVIFDMDGLLLDTHKIYTKVTKEMLGRYGKEVDLDFKNRMIGRRHEEIAPKVIEHYNLPLTVPEFTDQYMATIGHLLPNCHPLPGVERLINHLHAKGIPMAVATSSARENFDHKTTNHADLFSKFSHIVTGTDPELKRGKPAPDIFQLAAQRFPDAPEFKKCLVFEDAANGIEAARAAGMQSVMIPEEEHFDVELTKSATQLLFTMADFRPEDFGLPAFEDEV